MATDHSNRNNGVDQCWDNIGYTLEKETPYTYEDAIRLKAYFGTIKLKFSNLLVCLKIEKYSIFDIHCKMRNCTWGGSMIFQLC